MSILHIKQDDIEKITVITSPQRTYFSNSLGTTGSVKVYPRISSVERDPSLSAEVSGKNNNSVVDSSFDAFCVANNNVARQRRAGSAKIRNENIVPEAGELLTRSHNLGNKQNAQLEIERLTPGFIFDKTTCAKLNVKDMLMDYYRVTYPSCDWAYTNYHSLNFFNAVREDEEILPISSSLLYPGKNIAAPGKVVSSEYSIDDKFSFEFYINPRYKKDPADVDGHFKAGTIFHLSSSYALSLITGSSKDENNLPDAFRLVLQLSRSAGIEPSKINPTNYQAIAPNDLVFFSNDNSLKWNNWHKVVVSWGNLKSNGGIGKFYIDGQEKGTFKIPSSSIAPKAIPATGTWPEDPGVLCVGNFYKSNGIGNNGISHFFDKKIAKANGVTVLNSAASLKNPTNYEFSHPLKAEVHDLKITRNYVVDSPSKSRVGLNKDTIKNNVIFYVPPYFVEKTPMRYRYNPDNTSELFDDSAGIMQTPAIFRGGKTDDPFNVAVSFGVGGHYINLENFVKDFARNNWPRLISLSGSRFSYSNNNPSKKTANDYLYEQTNIAKRNLTVLPCDDGRFSPSFSLLTNEIVKNKYVDFGGSQNFSYINLDNLISPLAFLTGSNNAAASVANAMNSNYEDFAAQVTGPTPEKPLAQQSDALVRFISNVEKNINNDEFDDPGIQQGAPLMIYQRTQDPSSNQITLFNISNIYYGKRILPGSFSLKDGNLSGSYGEISITLKDDGNGNLYRADSITTHAKFNSVGNIFYDEGVVIIKNPHLYFFGKNEFEMSFRGQRSLFTTKYEILAPAGMINSSSNKTYTDAWDAGMRASISPDDEKEKFVYINNINIHDENMNVIAKANLAQPVIKRDRDKILFKFAFDW